MIAKITKSYIVDVSQEAFDHMLANGADDAVQSLEDNGDDSTLTVEKYTNQTARAVELEDEEVGMDEQSEDDSGPDSD